MSQAVVTKVELYVDKLKRRVAAKRKRVLFAQGKYLKTTMQRAMRYRKGASKPGQPPSAHRETGALLRKLIRFEVDLTAGSVVCGPPITPGSSVQSSKPLPQLMDEGGVATVNAKLVRNKKGATSNLGGGPVEIAARPFTAPVFTDGGKRFRELISEEKL